MSYSLRGAKLAFISKFHKTMLPLFDIEVNETDIYRFVDAMVNHCK